MKSQGEPGGARGAAASSDDQTVRDRGRCSVVEEWLEQEPVESEVIRRSELRDPEDHCFMAGGRLGAVSTAESIPPGECEPEIAVGLHPFDGVVDTMHIGGHDEPPEDLVGPGRQCEIGMVEE